MPAPPETRAKALLLYDGACGLCNAVVRFLCARDRRGLIRYAPLQSPTGQAVLRARGLPTEDFDSLVYLSDAGSPESPHFLRTDGVLAILDQLGGAWRLLAWMRKIPRGPRDAAYRVVARLRYRLFGNYLPGPLPDPAWAARFLDGPEARRRPVPRPEV